LEKTSNNLVIINNYTKNLNNVNLIYDSRSFWDTYINHLICTFFTRLNPIHPYHIL